jgi:hypothetical protein
MVDVVLFHHALGLTEGVRLFAEELRGAGHTVWTPDLFEGRTFSSIEEGMEFVSGIGFGEVIGRGVAAVAELPAEVVYAGFSLGVVCAQMLAQTRAGALGALLYYSCVPVKEFGESWPAEVPVQIHGMASDPVSSGRGMWTRRVRLSLPLHGRSCSFTTGTRITSPTAHCLLTTPRRPRCWWSVRSSCCGRWGDGCPSA